ncbi:unnamed protein product [Dibothriocephalus latus]|uniref:Uncharacterized protein n=1 Tax=Dibothriocephalus latus TaxID=60516 RepID=A0A3P6PW46_DIBLA|nr:unnamed protein product [Dibothriocephalus latus]
MRHRRSLEGDEEEEEDADTLGQQQQTSKAVDSSPNEEADQNSDSSFGPEDSDILEEDVPEGI